MKERPGRASPHRPRHRARRLAAVPFTGLGWVGDWRFW